MRKIMIAIFLILFLSSCRVDSPSPSPDPASSSVNPSASPTDQNELIITTRADEKVGNYLVDGGGRTVYMSILDTGEDSHTSTVTQWSAVQARDTVSAGKDLDESKLEVNGSEQVLYNGHLLYYYAGDSAPGDKNGEGIQSQWYLLDAEGNPIK